MLRHCERSEAISCRLGPLGFRGTCEFARNHDALRRVATEHEYTAEQGRTRRNRTSSPEHSPEMDSVVVMMRQRPEERWMLDFEECDSARIGRNPAYDGRFFTGVRTTGIYCRPVCPARRAQSKNVEYHPSAAAAEAAGYRPCLRCRPETAPFSAAWKGSLTTVERAMRLINEAALDDAGVDALAERLGIGARHLSRLFKKHVGASPSQVAQTARVQRAKRMIDNTDLAMTEIALVAGFGSLRRFNTVFAAVYKRPPTAIRRAGHAPMASAP
jgi:AraC family transcriptional regulator, regulatory protein of adaptative response / methylated-DNA-[protein]-cysteine methyltransferase